MFNIVTAGIDYSLAPLDEREKFSLTKKEQVELYNYMKNVDDILGATIISTCNRVELSLSLKENCFINPFEIICEFLNINPKNYKYKIYEGDDVINHLCMLACGAKSQIFGEDQIITQIKTSINLSREENMTDSIMEVLFRTAISCGKKIKSSLNLNKRETSIADCVIDVINENKFEIENFLVIGNGEMGKYMANVLVSNNYNVTVSVREYRHKKVVLPDNCLAIDYSTIYDNLHKFDAVVSATLSPHNTLRLEKFEHIENYPKFLFDLAVPRDIDINIKSLGDVFMYDVDSLSKNYIRNNHTKELLEIKIIIDKYINDFYKWYNFKQSVCLFGDVYEA